SGASDETRHSRSHALVCCFRSLLLSWFRHSTTAPGVAAYTVNGGSLDTYLAMSNGNYNTVVQAWDNCGNVYKTPVSITVE
ncbi:MAG: hypothetical protein WAN60_19385, partial [Candidatus Sulfotelmatobacter sp.]